MACAFLLQGMMLQIRVFARPNQVIIIYVTGETLLKWQNLKRKRSGAPRKCTSSAFKMYCSAKKGYHSTAPSFVNHYKDATTTKKFGGNKGAEIYYSGPATVTKIWRLIRPIILACNEIFFSLLNILGE